MTSHISPLSDTIDRFTQKAPTDVRGLAVALNLPIVVENMAPDVSGWIRRTRSGQGFEIGVNAHHASTRQRFTIAHEIAHFVLHRDLIGDGITDDALYRSGQTGEIEGQANAYAATLLMPAPLVRQAFRDGVRSFATMARQFDVSGEVARIRMRELRLGG